MPILLLYILSIIILKNNSTPMIIKPRAQQNERQLKINKSRMYKQMLDNQILGNERYKRQHSHKVWENNDSLISLQTHLMPTIERKKAQNLDSSFIYQASTHKLPSKKVNLPVLVDKNTLYRGQSRFIKVQQPQSISKNKKRHVQTEKIEQQQSDDDDQYNSTCEKIIQELQDIIRQPTKQKYRKRYNQFSQNSHYKRNSAKNKQIEFLNQTKERKQREGQKTQSINPQIGQNSLFSRYTRTEKKYSNEPVNEFEDDNDLGKNKTQIKQPLTRVKNISKYKVQYKQDLKDNSMKQRSGKYSQNHKLVNNNKIDQQGLKEIKSAQKEFKPYESLQNKFKQEQNKTDNNSSRHRQKFLEVLRKVKIRGQSLYLKMHKLPTNENFEQND